MRTTYNVRIILCCLAVCCRWICQFFSVIFAECRLRHSESRVLGRPECREDRSISRQQAIRNCSCATIQTTVSRKSLRFCEDEAVKLSQLGCEPLVLRTPTPKDRSVLNASALTATFLLNNLRMYWRAHPLCHLSRSIAKSLARTQLHQIRCFSSEVKSYTASPDAPRQVPTPLAFVRSSMLDGKDHEQSSTLCV